MEHYQCWNSMLSFDILNWHNNHPFCKRFFCQRKYEVIVDIHIVCHNDFEHCAVLTTFSVKAV